MYMIVQYMCAIGEYIPGNALKKLKRDLWKREATGHPPEHVETQTAEWMCAQITGVEENETKVISGMCIAH